ncbi:MAG: aspartate aminotransferase family protein [Lachnospiraceae bacterium]|jgi:acetylornithine/N-succinyldiaminopimelate aminotransferase|nr:aspartate aminotransferase family protein [Lachnospiraceae bacterium]
MEASSWIGRAESHILHTYNRHQIVWDHGEGVYLYDTEGKKYLDFAAGIAVMALGYGDQEYEDALKGQISKIIHTSNLYYNQPMIDAAEKICAVSGLDRVFFTNSGTEAIEGAVKAAKKYAYTKDGTTDHEIIAMGNSFHGRSLGALAVTGNAHYREPFEPLPGIVRFAEYNNLESVKRLINGKTCAIILETVQGEGGIYPATEEFLEGVYGICKERDILLILDEIQCGMGRTGHMFAWQAYGVKPDIMACAKALGCGVPVGAFVMAGKVAEASLKPGDHGTTYGGNPLAGAAVSKVLDIFKERRILSHVREVSGYLAEQLEGIKDAYGFVKERRGIGLMQGLELDAAVPVGEVSAKALEQGLVLITAGKNVLRFVPPLIIGKEHVDEMAGKLKGVLGQY